MATLSSGLPDHVGDDEDLARFLTQSSQYNSQMVKPAAFLPHHKSQETSVSRHGNEPLASLWEIGLEAAGERSLHGAALFHGVDVRSAQLEVFAAEPPPRHAAIRGWPWDANDPDLQKAKQKELAILLAREATFLRRC